MENEIKTDTVITEVCVFCQREEDSSKGLAIVVNDGEFNWACDYCPVEVVKQELPEIGVPVLYEDLIISCDTPFFL